MEAERLVNNIVTKVINEEIKNTNIDYNSYNMSKLNEIESIIDERILNELVNIDDGILNDFFVSKRVKKGRFRKIKNGILCDISIGSIRGSTLFANVGPTIPIKLLFSSGLNSTIDIDVQEYGINNVIIKVYFNVTIREQITMPISSKKKKIHIKKIIGIDIIKGEIPDYYTGLIK